ncbi:MAG: hypothetical protein IT509_02165 [Rhodocyclaceae bacterium]|nr:hypothetical protein [Rhodocyclaceae bacterium]
MIELSNHALHISFPEVHPKARSSVSFQRTLRIPDDNQDYPLPAGLGRFPVWPVDDFPVPERWREHGGVLIPMYQSEAMWIDFDSIGWPSYPFALKIAAGKINAITGDAWTNELSDDPQDYLVLPTQPWLDGFNIAEGIVRQFVAARLGDGHTAEEQLTGDAQWGGLQLIVYPMKAEAYRERIERPYEEEQSRLVREDYFEQPMFCRRQSTDEMGLAPGGRIEQEIAEDPYGIDVWDTSFYSRCFVHLLNSNAFHRLTGRHPPNEPITPAQYRKAGIPWFDYYQDVPRLPGAATLAKLDGLASRMFKQGHALDHNTPICVGTTVQLSRSAAGDIRDGVF